MLFEGDGHMITATELGQRSRRNEIGLKHLLHRLKDYIRSYPLNRDEPMPEHNFDWVVFPDHDPGTAVVNTLKEYPALWIRTLPDDVCIVRKSELTRAVGGEHIAEYLAQSGMNVVESQAARLQREKIEESYARTYREA